MDARNIILDNLKNLKNATDVILRGIKDERIVDGAINWASLHCMSSQYIMDNDGDTFYQVLIEEADPGATLLRAEVQERLGRMGWEGISVITEW